MRGETLLSLARAAVLESLGGPVTEVPPEYWLAVPGACFVTLKKGEVLRGCIGSIEARRPLGRDVVENAKAAAHEDPRFPPLQRNELDLTRFEVSVLTPLEALDGIETEAQAIARLRPGVDGVVLQWGPRRGVFIPKVWEQVPDPAQFLAHLRRKAGLPMDQWPSGTRLWRFTAQQWAEADEE